MNVTIVSYVNFEAKELVGSFDLYCGSKKIATTSNKNDVLSKIFLNIEHLQYVYSSRHWKTQNFNFVSDKHFLSFNTITIISVSF